MKRLLALVAALAIVAQPGPTPAQAPENEGPDTRLYLADGTLVEGQLVEKSEDLIILRVEEKIFTFENNQIDRIVTLESLGGGARTVTVTEFPYISFLGGAVTFGLLSWLQFDRAADNDKEADLNLEHGQLARAKKLEDRASRARLYGWSTAVLAAGSLGVALVPRKETRRVFPEITLKSGAPTLHLSYVYRF